MLNSVVGASLRPVFLEPAVAVNRLTNKVHRAATLSEMALIFTAIGTAVLALGGAVFPWQTLSSTPQTHLQDIPGAKTSLLLLVGSTAVLVLFSLRLFRRAQFLGGVLVCMMFILPLQGVFENLVLRTWSENSLPQLSAAEAQLGLGYDLAMLSVGVCVLGIVTSMLLLTYTHALTVRLFQATASQEPDATAEQQVATKVTLRQSLLGYLNAE